MIVRLFVQPVIAIGFQVADLAWRISGHHVSVAEIAARKLAVEIEHAPLRPGDVILLARQPDRFVGAEGSAAARPLSRNPRRDFFFNSRSRSDSGRTISGWRLVIVLHQFPADNHAAEIVPTRQNHLDHVNNKETDVAHGQKKMDDSRGFIAAAQKG